MKEKLVATLKKYQEVKLAILYGSLADERETSESDLDLGIAGAELISSDLKLEIIEELAEKIGRPVDLIDLQSAHGTILKQILTKGSVLYSHDTTLYAGIMKRMLFEDADFMPYYYRTIKEQRNRWMNS